MAIVAVLIGIAINVVSVSFPAHEEGKKNSTQAVKPTVISHTPYFPALLTMTKDIAELTIVYDERISITESGTVNFRLIPPAFNGLTPENTKPLKVELTGPEISVTPSSEKTFTPEQIMNEEVRWSWSYRPKSAGSNQLTLSFSELPFNKWYKPSAVLIGEGNYSDAHGFPFAYRAMGVGKTIGMPIPGTMTAVWWEGLQDNSLYFGIPQIGVKDMDGNYLENKQFEPDVKVAQEYDVVITGRDQQLEKAVEVLLIELDEINE